MRVRQFSKKTKATGSMLLAVVLLSGCSGSADTMESPQPVEPVVVTEPEPISLAFACAPSTSQALTRMAEDAVQSGSNFRDITDFRFVTLRKDNSGNIFSIPDSEVDNQESPADKTTFRYYHFDYCDMAQGVNSILVYAKAKDTNKGSDAANKIYNGSLTANIPKPVAALSDIYFEPEPIYPDATVVPAKATALADALTGVITAQWSASNNTVLQNLLGNFTNHGFNLPGSAASVKAWLTALATGAQSYIDGNTSALDGPQKDILREVENAAVTAANNITIAPNSYPRDLNLPDGGAALRWAEIEEGGVKVKKFVPQMQTTTLDDINTVSRFVYPPSLYYFVESGIWTSNTKITFDTYKNDDSWATVLNRFNGSSITSSTKTVAIADPLQYAVARLAIKVKADAENLKYREGDGNTIPINDGGTTNYFRLTGVIVSGQRLVDYQFKPASNLDSDMKFVYDSQVGDDFYLTITAFDDANAKVYNTLLLQSLDGEDVKVILEFEYTGTQEFRCLNGYVYPNTRFYLVGEVKANAYKGGTGDEASQGRVFTQDYTTTIEMTVTSLEKAYNVLPSILAKNLEIGVQTTPKWVAVKPTGPVIMD
ncbi:MAG: hypothetical protein IJV20_05150 [Prevotella sp.]|nr:hypothetical protein [Prevotella sp.]